MKAIIITRKLSKKEIREISKKTDASTIIFIKRDLNYNFGKNIKPIIIHDNEKEIKRINYEILNDVLSFGEIDVDGKKLTDYLMIGKLSIWHIFKFRIYFALRNLTYELNFIEKIQSDYKEIHYYGNYNNLYKVSNNLFIYPKKKTNLLFRINIFQIIKYLVFFVLRIFLSIVYQNYKKSPTHKHLVIDHSIKQTIININTLKKEKGNYNLAYFFEKLDNSFLILDEVNFPELKPSYRFYFHKSYFFNKNRIYGESILLSGIINKNIRKNIFEGQKQIKKKIIKLKRKEYSKKHMIILSMLENLSGSTFIYLLKYYSYSFFFKKNKFITVSTIDENSPRIKSILSAAKKEKTITIGIQHGAIHELHPAYMFTKQDVFRGVTTDYTLTFGKYWKELLINKCNYNEKSLFITGQIRTDIIPKLLQNLKPHVSSKKIILYASQKQRNPNLRKKAAEDVFRAAKNIKNSLLIVKLHPSEKNDVKYYQKIANSIGIKSYKIVYWEDLFLLISKSDIVVTCFSTVGAEAVYFKKPLVILDHLKQDVQNYHKEGVAFQAANSNDLENYLSDILSGVLKINNKAYNNFITKYAYIIDGKTSERILNFIKSFEKSDI